MRFDRIRLRNFKPYEDADLRLDRGVSVVLGPNGSGKSSLLEACFFALYGSKALDDVTLADLMTRGAEESEVELWFTHDGDPYHVRRRLRRTDDRARTADCVLETPTATVEGATDVRSRIVEMVRMDADAFVNCAYVRQGEVNKLIHATPEERQDMIDDLLQLGRLETYRDRAGEARLGVSDLLEGRREVVEALSEQVSEKEDRDLHAQLNELESEQTSVEKEIERFEENRKEARKTREEARAVLDRHEEAREELEEVEATVESVREAVARTERKREELGSEIEEIRERREELNGERADRLADLDVASAVPDPDLLTVSEDDGDTEGRADGVDTDTGDRTAAGELPDPSTVTLETGAEPSAVEASLAALEAVGEIIEKRLNRAEMRHRELSDERERRVERAEELQAEAERRREEASELAQSVAEERTTLEERRERLETVDDEIDALRTRLDDAPVDRDVIEDHRDEMATEREDIRETLNELQAQRERRADRIAEAEELLAAGKCPECGQPVEDSPHVDRLEEDRERLAELDEKIADHETTLEDIERRLEEADELRDVARELDGLEETREDVKRLIEDKEGSIADDEQRVTELRERADDLASDAEDEREMAAELAEELSGIEDSTETLEEALSRVETAVEETSAVVELDERIAEATQEIESGKEERERLSELNDERRDRLAELRERRETLREEVDEERVETARQELERAEDYLENVGDRLEALRERRDQLQERVGAVNAELEQLEELRKRHEAVAEEVEALESLYGEVETLEATYGDLRADLRRRNVEVLERMLNDTFDLVYGGDAYAGIELGDDYELTVYQKDGEPLDPEQLSGGERALFNLSLRCAIYRLLAEGVEGTAPLPPLILDEPTVFLDSEHVSRLINLVEEMRRLGVEQIVVVSHDEELVGAADSVVRVSKDPTTNRSTVSRDDAVIDAPAAE